MDFDELRRIRGADIAMVFQDPLASLDPSFTIGYQLVEAIRLHERVSRTAARDRASRLLESVHIPDPIERLSAYPHQLSGGMRQRVMIAMALSCYPRLLIADEPTTALDVTVQAQIVELLNELRETEGLAVLFVTHDLALISELSDEVAVMYAGQVVEHAATADLFTRPLRASGARRTARRSWPARFRKPASSRRGAGSIRAVRMPRKTAGANPSPWWGPVRIDRAGVVDWTSSRCPAWDPTWRLAWAPMRWVHRDNRSRNGLGRGVGGGRCGQADRRVL
jgi:ABC-type microcin C transport system duplicated ATPase subunit YejF